MLTVKLVEDPDDEQSANQRRGHYNLTSEDVEDMEDRLAI